jgi:hypothetical protein
MVPRDLDTHLALPTKASAGNPPPVDIISAKHALFRRIRDSVGTVLEGGQIPHDELWTRCRSHSRCVWDNVIAPVLIDHFFQFADVYSRHIPLRLLTELRSIEFSVYEFRHDGTTAQCLLALLSQVTSPIEEVIMKSAAKSWTDSDEAVWAAISALLCGQQFEHLRRLCFQFNVYPINDEEARLHATSHICAHLPECEARGILEFSSTV